MISIHTISISFYNSLLYTFPLKHMSSLQLQTMLDSFNFMSPSTFRKATYTLLDLYSSCGILQFLLYILYKIIITYLTPYTCLPFLCTYSPITTQYLIPMPSYNTLPLYRQQFFYLPLPSNGIHLILHLSRNLFAFHIFLYGSLPFYF